MAGAAMAPVAGALPETLASAAERAAEYARRARAEATVRAYHTDWAHFAGWCEVAGLQALPAEETTVALYLAEAAETHSTATLQRRLSSIAQVHRAAGYPSPTQGRVSLVWSGIRRTKGTAQHGKAPVRTNDLRRMVEGCAQDLAGVRDRALLLVGFAGAFRRSELVGLDVADLSFGGDGLTVTIRRSKTDQEGAGQKVGIPFGSRPATCPVRALRGWLEAAGITEGPVFRAVDRWGHVRPARLTDRAVALVVKARAEAAGLDPTQYAGHSLRSGLATAAAEAGVSERVIMAQTRHKSVPMVRRYIREGSLFRENAAAGVGL